MNKIQIKNYNKISQIVLSRGGKVLSEEFFNQKIKMKFICNNNHIWEAAPRNILYANSWCPICYREISSKKLIELSKNKYIELNKNNNDTHKLCKFCNKIKEINSFSFLKYKRKNNDFLTYGNKCNDCVKYYNNNYKKDIYVSSIENFLSKKLEFSKKNAKNLNIDINLDFLINLWKSQNGKCAISGINMTFKRNKITDVSIDRIDSNLGYLKNNIHLVCVSVNFMKRDTDIVEFINMCKIIAENNK